MPTTQTDPLLGVTYQYDDQGNLLGYTGGDGQYYAAGGRSPQQQAPSGGGSIDGMIQSAANEFGVDPNVLANMVGIESGGDPNAYRGDDGYGGGPSVGLMQVKPDIWGGLAQQIGADPYDPMGNLRLGAAILAQGVAQYGSYDAAIRNVYFPANDSNGTTQDDYVARALGGAAPSFGGGSSGGGSSSGSGGSSGQSQLQAMQAWQRNWVDSHTQGGGGGGYQKDATVPGGSSAGGWGARSAPPITGGGSSGGGSSGGGGGGQIRSLESAIRSKLIGGLYPGSGGGSSYSSGYSSAPSAPAKPTPWWDYKIPGNPHGFSQGMDENTLAQTIYSNPEYVIPDALPNMKLGGPELASLSALPMTQFAMTLSQGKSNVSQYTNLVGQLYKKIANTPYFPKFGTLARDLTHLPGSSPLQDQFDPTAFIPYSPGSSYGSYNTPSQAASNYLGYLSNIANATLYGPVAQGATGYAQTLATKWGNRALHANPQNIQSINKYVGRRLFK